MRITIFAAVKILTKPRTVTVVTLFSHTNRDKNYYINITYDSPINKLTLRLFNIEISIPKIPFNLCYKYYNIIIPSDRGGQKIPFLGEYIR